MRGEEGDMDATEEKRFRILVGYDGSNTSKDAVELGKKYTKAFDAKLFIVTCLESDGAGLEEIKRCESDLDKVQVELDKTRIRNETHLLVRDERPGEGLVGFAKDKGIDQIILGVKRRSRVEKFVFGSICSYVILEAPCPVVTVK
jgi:nucleotide-binding universal stress UspA family protein